MKFSFAFLFLFLLDACTPIYILKNKQKVQLNDSQIIELTKLIDRDDIPSFLKRVEINNHLIFNSKDTLGFGYYFDMDHRCLNTEICFGTQIVRQAAV
jgi:hypothetical protein